MKNCLKTSKIKQKQTNIIIIQEVPQIKLLKKLQLTQQNLNSVKNRAASDWNQISKNLNTEDKPQLINSLREYIFNSYN